MRRTKIFCPLQFLSLGETEFLVRHLLRCEEDLYDSETNRTGYVNLGTAVNALVEDLIQERLDRVTEWMSSDEICT